VRSNAWARLAFLLAAAVATSTCSGVAEDDALERRLEALEWSTDRVALHDLTDFSWETVFIFGPYEEGSAVNKAVGGEVMAGGARVDEFENILVFVADGKPVRQVRVKDMFAWGARAEWPADVELIGGPVCRLALVLPSDPDPPASC